MAGHAGSSTICFLHHKPLSQAFHSGVIVGDCYCNSGSAATNIHNYCMDRLSGRPRKGCAANKPESTGRLEEELTAYSIRSGSGCSCRRLARPTYLSVRPHTLKSILSNRCLRRFIESIIGTSNFSERKRLRVSSDRYSGARTLTCANDPEPSRQDARLAGSRASDGFE